MHCCSFFASQGSLALVPVGMWQIIIIIIIIIIIYDTLAMWAHTNSAYNTLFCL